MIAYALGAQQPSGPFAKIYPAWCEKYQKDVIVKVYQRSGMTTAENLLREAIRQARTKPKESASLLEVLLNPADSSRKDSKFTVNFILEKKAQTIAGEVLMRNDDRDSGPPGLSAYQNMEALPALSSTGKIYKAYAPHLQKDVIIKSISILYVDGANPYIKEAFLQAYVEHDRNCKLIDLCITKKPNCPSFEIHLVMERMLCDMKVEMDNRIEYERFFTEEELLHILEDVAAGLTHAKSFVISTQHIAHRDIKPLNILLGSDGRCKLGDFGSAWKKAWMETMTKSSAGTTRYVSMEMRNCMSDPDFNPVDAFISDIYSLGLTVLHFALLQYPIDIEKSDAAALNECLTRRVREMHYSEEFKQLIAEMVAINPMERPRLDNVIAKVQMLLQKRPPPPSPQPVPRIEEESKSSEPAAVSQPQIKAAAQAFSEQTGLQAPPHEESKQVLQSEPTLVHVTANNLRLFDFQLNSWKKAINFKKPIACDLGSRYVFWDVARIVVCGSAS